MLTRIESAAVEVVPVELFRSYLRLNDEEEIALLATCLQATIDKFERETPILIGEQTWKLTLTNWQPIIYIQKSPLNSIETIEYYDEDENLQEFEDYELVGNKIFVNDTPNLSSTKKAKVFITFKAGYTSFDALPKDIMLGFFRLATDFSEQRTESIDANTMNTYGGFRHVINNYKYKNGFGEYNLYA